MELGRYRKLVAAVVGIAALLAMRYFDIEVPGLQPIVIDLVIGGLTSIGVYQVAND